MCRARFAREHRHFHKSKNGKVIISNLDEIWKDYRNIVKEEIRNAREYVHQAKLIGHHVKPNNQIYEDIVDDIVHVLKTKYGLENGFLFEEDGKLHSKSQFNIPINSEPYKKYPKAFEYAKSKIEEGTSK